MKVKINKNEVEAKDGETILSVAEKNGIYIPTLCFHEDLKIKESCRVCVVDVDGKIVPACSTKVRERMEILTDSPEVVRARKINLELLFAQHEEECDDCIWHLNCKMLDIAKKYGAEISRFKDRKSLYPVYRFGKFLEFDSSKCIDCRNCIEVCKNQGVSFLERRGKGHLMEILPSLKKEKDCVYCGQCILHCPAGAFEAVGEFEEIEKPFEKIKKKIIFQIAPAVRATIGEEFGLSMDECLMEKIVASLKQIGAEKVFDVSTGADFTTVEESKELLERVEKRDLPMFTACCPSWVRFVELYYPEFISRLTSVRSPHIILGGLIKEYFAKKEGLLPDDIYLVSLMPCIAKKYEIGREELKVNGRKTVDYVMTTREAGRLFKKNKIDFKNIKEEKADTPFGSPSGSGVTYGVSGGVMQSACYNITGRKIIFEEEEEGVKVAEVSFLDRKLRLAVVYGLGNAKKILERMKKGKVDYDYIEVMACPGGCIGGGGQSVPVNKKIRMKRREKLYKAGEKKEVKKAEENPEIKEMYKSFLNTEEKLESFCHTKYKKASKSPISKIENKRG